MPKNKVYFVLLKCYIIIIYACIKHHIAKLLIVGSLAKQLGMSQPGVGYAVNRGEKIAKEHKYQLL